MFDKGSLCWCYLYWASWTTSFLDSPVSDLQHPVEVLMLQTLMLSCPAFFMISEDLGPGPYIVPTKPSPLIFIVVFPCSKIVSAFECLRVTADRVMSYKYALCKGIHTYVSVNAFIMYTHVFIHRRTFSVKLLVTRVCTMYYFLIALGGFFLSLLLCLEVPGVLKEIWPSLPLLAKSLFVIIFARQI